MNRATAGEHFIGDLATALDIPPERYEAADRSYRSVCTWLERPDSQFNGVDIQAYAQGSFRLGTVIRPLSGEEDYDLDVVFEFDLSKGRNTQEDVYEALGAELMAYARRYGMEPPQGWDRCWTLNYSDSAQFHMDLLPSVPDGQRQRVLREQRMLSLAHVQTSISITDRTHVNYRLRSDDWPSSNPKGYADWFYARMKPAFDQRRRAMMLAEAKADVEDIPSFRVKTPLQAAIQLLKRHRDMRFSEVEDGRPSSIIISTLAAHAYNQEGSVTGALLSILASMDRFIHERNGVTWIENPSNPRENFADGWEHEPVLKEGFYEWLEVARSDFALAAQQDDMESVIDILAPRMGRPLVESAVLPTSFQALARSREKRRSPNQRLADAPHRKPMTWPKVPGGNVHLLARSSQNGFRTGYVSSGVPVRRGCSLNFMATTDVAPPFKVYWQIVNTGKEAAKNKGLRGGFEMSTSELGSLWKDETALYIGTHTIECFIVKDNYCAARSGQFVVDIKA